MTDIGIVSIFFGSIAGVLVYFAFLAGDEIEDRVEMVMIPIFPIGVILILARRKWRALK